MNEQKEKLIELLQRYTSCLYRGNADCNKCGYRKEPRCFNAQLADYLIANGVVMPCDVGDTVYQEDGERVYETKITRMIYETDGVGFDSRAIGKHVFLTREEAERALKGGGAE